jgi:hypothetical protein
MKVMLTVGQRNPKWFWSKEEMKEFGDSYKEWQIINEGKIDKFNPSWSYQMSFDVKEIIDNRNADYELKVRRSPDSNQEISVVLNDVTVLKFIGEIDTAEIVISNSLIHQYIEAKKRKYKNYIYFYLKENLEFEHFDRCFWLAESDLMKVDQALINHQD